jgi:hypothetical protein
MKLGILTLGYTTGETEIKAFDHSEHEAELENIFRKTAPSARHVFSQHAPMTKEAREVTAKLWDDAEVSIKLFPIAIETGVE